MRYKPLSFFSNCNSCLHNLPQKTRPLNQHFYYFHALGKNNKQLMPYGCLHFSYLADTSCQLRCFCFSAFLSTQIPRPHRWKSICLTVRPKQEKSLWKASDSTYLSLNGPNIVLIATQINEKESLPIKQEINICLAESNWY